MNIYVGNLSYDLDEAELKDVFAEYGEVESVKIVIDRETGRSKGFAFVTMANDDAGRTAMQALDGAEVAGRPLKVNEARPKEDRPSGGGRSFGGGGGGGGGGFGGQRKPGGFGGGGRSGGERDRRRGGGRQEQDGFGD